MSEKRRDSKGRILRNGEVQRPDGQYMFRYNDANGKRHTVYSWKLVETDKVPDGKKCKVALRDMIKAIQRDLDDGIRTDEADEMTVNELFDYYMGVRKDLRSRTRCNYICLYNKHVRDAIGFRKLKAIKYTTIQQLYISLIDEKKLKGTTVEKIHAFLFQMFESAVRDSVLRTNPTASVLKGLRRRKKSTFSPVKRHALTEEQQEKFIEYVYASEQYKRFGPMFTVLLGTGMRIGELLGLRWCDCDFDESVITVDHELLYKPTEKTGYIYTIDEPKTEAGVRMIPMLSEVRTALMQERSKKINPFAEPFSVNGYSGFIFLNGKGKVFTPNYIYQTIQDITDRYNHVEGMRAKKEKRKPCLLPKFSAHSLRHTFCTRFCENETNIKVIQEIMGHTNARTTMDIYNEATESKKKEGVKNLEGKIKLA